MSDQFVGRNFWRSIKVGLARLGGSREENDVLIGKDGQLMEEISVPDQDQLNDNLAAIKSFGRDIFRHTDYDDACPGCGMYSG